MEIVPCVRDMKYTRWKMAIERSMGWAMGDEEKRGDARTDFPCLCDNGYEAGHEDVLRSLPAGLFLVSSVALVVVAEIFRQRSVA